MSASDASKVNISRNDIEQIVQSFDKHHEGELTLAQGVESLRACVTEAFAHIDLSQEDREPVNNLINALQSLYEEILEQDQDASEFAVEREDWETLRKSTRLLKLAGEIQHHKFDNHKVASAISQTGTAIGNLSPAP